MPEELSSPPRLLVEPEEHIWAGQTATKAAMDAAADEPLPENPQATLAQIRECPAYKDHRHPDHQTALDQERRLCFGIVHAADKAAEAAASPAEPTMEEKEAILGDVDRELIDAGAVALLGDQGPATIEADTNIANDPEAIKLLGELGQLERDFPGASDGVRLHLHLTPAQAKQTIAEKRDDPKFMQAYHNNADFRHNAAIGEMQCLNLIAEGGILKWQQQQQAQPQS